VVSFRIFKLSLLSLRFIATWAGKSDLSSSAQSPCAPRPEDSLTISPGQLSVVSHLHVASFPVSPLTPAEIKINGARPSKHLDLSSLFSFSLSLSLSPLEIWSC
jgi:hypothetical protein